MALRKIETLLKYDARIQVVSAAVDSRIAGLLPADRIHLLDIRVPGEEMQKTGYSEKIPFPTFFIYPPRIINA